MIEIGSEVRLIGNYWDGEYAQVLFVYTPTFWDRFWGTKSRILVVAVMGSMEWQEMVYEKDVVLIVNSTE